MLAEGISQFKIAEKLGIRTKTIRKWRDDDVDGFCAKYARAESEGMDAHAEKILNLADNITPENANAVRVTIDTYKWVMCKLGRKRYGEKQEIEHKGEVNLVTTVNVIKKNG